MITQKSLGKNYTAIQKFNDISGNLDNITQQSIALQLDLIQEEYLETVQAYDEEDMQEICDGAADMFVVVCGLLQKLEAYGCDMEEILNRVCENNLSKYPTVGMAIRYDPALSVTVNEKHQVYVIKDINGKVRKPLDFVPVNLFGCVPKTFFKEAM